MVGKRITPFREVRVAGERDGAALVAPGVLDVAQRNAEAAGVADRWQALPGSALEVPLGGRA